VDEVRLLMYFLSKGRRGGRGKRKKGRERYLNRGRTVVVGEGRIIRRKEVGNCRRPAFIINGKKRETRGGIHGKKKDNSLI